MYISCRNHYSPPRVSGRWPCDLDGHYGHIGRITLFIATSRQCIASACCGSMELERALFSPTVGLPTNTAELCIHKKYRRKA